MSSSTSSASYGLLSSPEELSKATTDWEVDCYSRPVKDENGKKVRGGGEGFVGCL